MDARVVTSEMLGSESHYQIETKLGRFMVKSFDNTHQWEDGSQVFAHVRQEDLCFFAGPGYRIQPYFNNYSEYLERFRRCIHEALQ